MGARFRNELPVSPWDAMRYAWESCEALLRDASSIAATRKPDRDPHARWDVAVLDGAYPECMLGILHGENVPTIMLNTVIRLSPWPRSATGPLSRYSNSRYSLRPGSLATITVTTRTFTRADKRERYYVKSIHIKIISKNYTQLCRIFITVILRDRTDVDLSIFPLCNIITVLLNFIFFTT